jgi:hypothetical protein
MRRPSTSALVICIALGLLATGCGKKTEEATGDAVTGEVLPGSISDAMIDLDTSTAAPPLAPVKPADKTTVQGSPSDAAPDVVADTEPAAKPADKAPADSADTE